MYLNCLVYFRLVWLVSVTFFILMFQIQWVRKFSTFFLLNMSPLYSSLVAGFLSIQTLIILYQFSLVTQSCLTLCDPMDRSMTGFPVHHQLPEFTQTHVHWVGDAIQPSHHLSVSYLFAFSYCSWGSQGKNTVIFQCGNINHVTQQIIISTIGMWAWALFNIPAYLLF